MRLLGNLLRTSMLLATAELLMRLADVNNIKQAAPLHVPRTRLLLHSFRRCTLHRRWTSALRKTCHGLIRHLHQGSWYRLQQWSGSF